jgi:UDP-N-acetylmuramoylalanine--D-glutamate ligase
LAYRLSKFDDDVEDSMTDRTAEVALVLGLGDSGLAMARLLAARGYALRVADTRSDPPWLTELRSELPQAEFVSGEFSLSLLDDVCLVALSPGLSPTLSAVAPLVKGAYKRKIDVVGEIELFARELLRLKTEMGYTPQIIGVTGTNGKTTTSRLTGLIVEAAGKRVQVAGNIAPVALDALRIRVAAHDLPEVWVLELSSFHLATTRSLVCDAAAVLNISDDHLDWHGTLDAYAASKARIFGPKTVRILNRDDPRVAAMARKDAHTVTFGDQAPISANAYGIVVDHGVAWLAWAEDLSAPSRRRKAEEQSSLLHDAPGVRIHRLMPVDALALRGRHNATNALAALALARSIDCPLAPMMHELSRYAGEPHRLQLIATIDGVAYYDDSKGTNVGATVAALEGLGAEGKKLVVIAGGDGKGQNFEPLAAPVAHHARAVVVLGRDAVAIRSALERGAPGVPLLNAQNLEQAVDIASAQARPGDAVLLSPACASFDMFRNYMHRGEVFAEAVRDLSAEAGQPS